MIDYTITRSIIEKHISANFNTCAIIFENVSNNQELVEYIELTDTIITSETISVGVVKCDGMLTIHINTTIGTGTARSRSIAKELDLLLANKEIEGIQFTESELKPVPLEGKDKYHKRNLHIPYVFSNNGSIG